MARKKIIPNENEEPGQIQNQKKYHHHKSQNSATYHGGSIEHGAHAKNWKQRGPEEDSYHPMLKQLAAVGLTIKEMPGDG